MSITLSITIYSCLDCPNRASDRDAESYCNADEASDGFHEYQLYEQNRQTLTESCPLIIVKEK